MGRLRAYENAFFVVGLLSILLLIPESNAFEFRVGGSTGTWTVPNNPNATIYNQWAEMNRFQIGDTLLFVYAPSHDSVLHVTKDDYTKCKTSSPLEKFSDGHTVFSFNQSGPYYFISGVADNCHKNEKMIVVVMADRNKHSSPHPSPSAPSPAPAGQESPPPPSGVEMNPTPAPSQEYKPFTDSSSKILVTGVFGTIAAVIVSSLVMAI